MPKYEPRFDGFERAETTGRVEITWLTPEWCVDVWYGVNPGARHSVPHMPSLYLLDFAHAVLLRAETGKPLPCESLTPCARCGHARLVHKFGHCVVESHHGSLEGCECEAFVEPSMRDPVGSPVGGSGESLSRDAHTANSETLPAAVPVEDHRDR